MFVHEKIYDELLENIISRTKRLRIGIDVGPIIDNEERDRIAAFVDDAVANGARIWAGGNAQEPGYFYSPTVLACTSTDPKLFKTECFGPLLPLVRVRSEEEAIRLANETEYGLGASVWTADDSAANRIADQLRVGMVWINDVNVAFPQAPWGGRKHSGVGYELSEHSIFEYLTPKHINKEGSNDDRRAWWYPY